MVQEELTKKVVLCRVAQKNPSIYTGERGQGGWPCLWREIKNQVPRQSRPSGLYCTIRWSRGGHKLLPDGFRERLERNLTVQNKRTRLKTTVLHHPQYDYRALQIYLAILHWKDALYENCRKKLTLMHDITHTERWSQIKSAMLCSARHRVISERSLSSHLIIGSLVFEPWIL